MVSKEVSAFFSFFILFFFSFFFFLFSFFLFFFFFLFHFFSFFLTLPFFLACYTSNDQCCGSESDKFS